MLHQKLESTKTTTGKIELTRQVLSQEKFCNIENVNFDKNGSKVENSTFLHFMTSFHNFSLILETG